MFNKLLRGAVGAGAIISLMVLNGCGSGSVSAATDAKKNKVIVGNGNSGGTAATSSTTTTSTMTAATPGEPVLSPNGTKGEFDVADNFTTSATLQVSTETVPASLDPGLSPLTGQALKHRSSRYPRSLLGR